MLFRNLQRISRFILAVLLIAIIAVVDWRVEVNIAFGFLLYIPATVARDSHVALANSADGSSLHISRRLL